MGGYNGGFWSEMRPERSFSPPYKYWPKKQAGTYYLHSRGVVFLYTSETTSHLLSTTSRTLHPSISCEIVPTRVVGRGFKFQENILLVQFSSTTTITELCYIQETW